MRRFGRWGGGKRGNEDMDVPSQGLLTLDSFEAFRDAEANCLDLMHILE